MDEQKSAYLKLQIERLERLVQSDDISEEKLQELSTRLGVVRSFQRETFRRTNNRGGHGRKGRSHRKGSRKRKKNQGNGALSALMGVLSAFMWSNTGVTLMLTSVFVGLYTWKHILDERAKMEVRRLQKEQSLRKIKQRKRRERVGGGTRSTSVSTDSTAGGGEDFGDSHFKNGSNYDEDRGEDANNVNNGGGAHGKQRRRERFARRRAGGALLRGWERAGGWSCRSVM